MPLTEAAAPDWTQQVEEILCPLCDYNLRGLVEPRCPECGHQFEWINLTDPAQRRHPYLFEHHPQRNLWSLEKTMRGAMRPSRFWNSLHPAQPSSRRRLVIYWLVGVALVMATPIGQLAIKGYLAGTPTQGTRKAYADMLKNNQIVSQRVIAQFGSIDRFLDQYGPQDVWHMPGFILRQYPYLRFCLTLAGALAIWPWAILLMLTLIFRVSMRRTRVHSDHVLRCAVYSLDFGVALSATLSAGILLAIVRILWPGYFTDFRGLILLALFIGVLLTATWRLIQAYRHYLRFPHAAGVVMAVQVIFILSLAELLICTMGYGELHRMLAGYY